MAKEIFNRFEDKFLFDTSIYHQIREELLQYMESDSYNQKYGFYTISNLYYDTFDNHLIRTSLSKPRYKEKLRLRAYGTPKIDDTVYVEIKKKVCGLVNKRRTSMSLKDAYHFLQTKQKPLVNQKINRQVLNEITYMLNHYALSPKLYLAYDREAFFGVNNKDLRITFDTNIRSRRYDLRLESGGYGRQLLEQNQWLMEVKTPRRIPLWLSKLLAKYKTYSTSFSKYGTEYRLMLQEQRKWKGANSPCQNSLRPYPAVQPQQYPLAMQF